MSTKMRGISFQRVESAARRTVSTWHGLPPEERERRAKELTVFGVKVLRANRGSLHGKVRLYEAALEMIARLDDRPGDSIARRALEEARGG